MGYEEIIDKDILLESYSSGYLILKKLIDDLDQKVIEYVPDIDGAWSIKEHLGHLVDTEVNGYIRFQKAILNPGGTIDFGAGDMEKSNKILGYSSQNFHDRMEFFRLIRKLITEHVKKIKYDDFDKFYIEQINHPTFKKCTLGFIL